MARVSQWNWSDFTQEWSQTQAINDLDDELAAERAARRRQMEDARNRFEQDLEQVDSKLDSVSGRIEALLAWTELRFQLIEFDEYQARKEIRNTVRALAEGRVPLLRGFEDVPGYWLPSAAAAVLPLVVRDRVPTQRTGRPFADLKTGLETARERDAVRTELFSLAVGRCFGQPAFIDAAALRLLAEPADLGVAEPGQVARGWRTLWEQAALGAFGPGPKEQIAALLRERFDPGALDEEALAAWDDAVERFGANDSHQPTRTEALAALQAHFAEEPGPAAATGAPMLAPAVTPAGETPDTGPEPSPSDPARDDTAWRRYLQELIEEPSPAELPLVRQMAELDPASGGRDDDRSWTAPVGTVADLLRRDLFDPAAPIPLRRLALGLAAPILRARLDHLEASIGTTETVTVTVRRRGELIHVTKDGHDPEQFAAVERRVDQAFAAAAPSKPLTIAFASVLGLLSVSMLVIAQWFAAVLFALGVVIPLWRYRTDAAKARKGDERRDDQLAEIRAALLTARKDAESRERAETERGIATRRALADLRESLPAEPDSGALDAPGASGGAA
ncbi:MULTISPECIES: hypothetical protein [Glycomyces]|uniref:Uncharacterized protein n=2 Tax=Glycomyces TaxID=58113 RepID=A0A9X3PJX9_9ACTN|nr:hypothetical protein [Glycomyces lechevalierae]MDA1384993.1 hypothetical protein [Glycomyces lechevalierae]MDR7337555.1 hypothetical protein [Glycomyces lechevalierae]